MKTHSSGKAPNFLCWMGYPSCLFLHHILSEYTCFITITHSIICLWNLLFAKAIRLWSASQVWILVPSYLVPILGPFSAGRINCRACPKSSCTGVEQGPLEGQPSSSPCSAKTIKWRCRNKDTISPNPTPPALQKTAELPVSETSHLPKGMLASESPSGSNSRGQFCAVVSRVSIQDLT